MSRQLILKVVSGPFEDLNQCEMSQLFHWLQLGQSLTVGRGGFHVDWAVRQDALMSRQHFRVSCAQQCYLVDLDTANGTYLNGQPVTETVLQDGDIIRAGKTVFAVGITGEETPEGEPGTVADLADPVAASKPGGDTQDFSRVVFKIVSGPFAELELVNMTQLLNWVDVGQSVIVGRSPQADFAIHQDRRMSSRHFALSYDGRVCRIRDLNSRNGTFVNGIRVSMADLKNGDRILAGHSVFSIAVLGDPEQGPARTGPADDADLDEQTIRPGISRLADDARTPPMQAVLTIVAGPGGDLRELKVSRLVAWLGGGQTLTIGRSTVKADFVIGPDAVMSDSHFRLSCDGEFCRLQDLGSRTGTFVNGRLVDQVALSDGDEIVAGGTIFRVAVQGGRPAKEATFESDSPPADEDEDSWSETTCVQHPDGPTALGKDIRARLKQPPPTE